MEMRGLMGGFYRISEWVMRLSVINVLWLVCSAPWVYCTLPLFHDLLIEPSQDIGRIVTALGISAIVAPFFLIPATAAAFAVARKWVSGEDDAALLKTFFRSYKQNYVQALLGGFVFLILFVVLGMNYYFYSGRSDYLQMFSFLFIALMFVLAAGFINFLSMMVHFHMKLWALVKNALLMTIGRPISSILILVSNAIVIYLSAAFMFPFFFIFFTESVLATVSFWYFYRNFRRIQAKAEEAEGESAERAEQSDYEDLPDTGKHA